MNRPNLLAAAALIALAALHYATVPRTVWEFDEGFFALAVEEYQPWLHHPPPPGYPIYIAFAKVLALFTGDPFRALLVTSILTLAAGLAAWFFAFREIGASESPGASLSIGVIATAILYTSPAVLVSGTLPQSDSGALALFGLAAFACARRNPYFAALACAACIGWRLQFSIAIVPMFVVALVLLDGWRARAKAVVTFGIACLVWFVPLVVATGGPLGFWKWLSGQAAYYASHDAGLSRSGYSTSLIGLRFVAHPWGPKWLSIPLLAIAAGGAALVVLRRMTPILPLAAGGAVYLAFALATMDPADAVRYAIPSLPAIAAIAAIALTRLRWLAVPIVAAYAIGATIYSAPVVRHRATHDAPPHSAAAWIRANVPRNAIILFDAPLRPHADYLLRDYQSMRIDAGLAKYGGDTRVPMVIYADGERADAPGVTFRWPDTDAYRKLTREHYGAVSVIPLPPSGRYRAVEGIHPPERTRSGEAWRWIAAHGMIELPDIGASRVRLRFRAPRDYLLDENRVRVAVHGREFFVTVQRGATSELVVPIPRGTVRILIDPEQQFVPAKIEGANNRDARTLSVMLAGIEQF